MSCCVLWHRLSLHAEIPIIFQAVAPPRAHRAGAFSVWWIHSTSHWPGGGRLWWWCAGHQSPHVPEVNCVPCRWWCRLACQSGPPTWWWGPPALWPRLCGPRGLPLATRFSGQSWSVGTVSWLIPAGWERANQVHVHVWEASPRDGDLLYTRVLHMGHIGPAAGHTPSAPLLDISSQPWPHKPFAD